MTIVEFLLARISEDEAWAHVVQSSGIHITQGPSTSASSAARVLAECEAKRRIVEQLHRELRQVVQFGRPETESLGCETCWRDEYDPFGPEREPYPCPTLKALASVYADHPDYRDEWRV